MKYMKALFHWTMKVHLRRWRCHYVTRDAASKSIVGDKMTNQKTYYITSHGILRRERNTLLYISGGKKRKIPVETVRCIIVFGNMTLKGGVIPFLAKKSIPVQFHSQNGYYQNTLQNVDKNMNGLVLREQTRHTLDARKRMILACLFVRGAVMNLSKNLKRKEIAPESKTVLEKISDCRTPQSLMGVEGSFRKKYYEKMDTVLPKPFKLEKRSYHPPLNQMNALISLGNSLLYSAVMSEIYHTQLHPAISFLHEPYRQRFSLALDISEVFKPVIVDRVVHKLVNRHEIREDDFLTPLESFYLKKNAKKKFITRFDEKLNSTLYHNRLKRNVSYRRLLRLEAYKIQKHVLGDEKYSPYVITR
jgi:CRISPR-associated protein Cas1